MTYQSGRAEADYILNIDQPRRAAQELIGIFARVKAAGAGVGQASGAGGGAAGLGQQSAAAGRAAIAQQRLATETQRTALASNQAATAGQRLATEQQRTAGAASNAAAAQTRAEGAALRLARAQEQTSRSTSIGGQAFDAFKGQLLGFLGPAAAVGAAFGLLRSAANSAREGLELTAQLDATTASINAQLRGVRDTGQVYRQASAFANEFKLTQLETTEAVSASIGVMRSSRASVEDILGVLARMQVLSPEQSLQEAAIALKALASGDTTSLVTRFEVGRDVATQMKNEIQGGADAVQVMSRFLGETGIGMDALKAKTEGVSGALKDAKIAAENLLIAEGRLAAKGVGFTQVHTDAINLLADAVGGNLNPAFDSLGNTVTTSLGGAFAFGGGQIKQLTGDAFGLGTAIQGLGIDSIVYGQSARIAGDATQSLGLNMDAERRAVQGATEASAALAEANAALAASQLTGAAAAFDQAVQIEGVSRQARDATIAMLGLRASQDAADAKAKQDANATGIGALAKGFGGGAGTGAAEQAEKVRQARLQFALTQARSNAQKIGLLQRELNRTTDTTERLHLQTQIANLQQSGTARVGAATRTGQQLATVEQNSGLQQARIQRENLEKLRDQQEDFEVGRTRKQEDFARERQRLLAQGQRGAAARLSEDFARDQRRAQEDFNRTRGRTLRNNQEGVGDTDARSDLRQSQILARAGLGPATGRPALSGPAGGGGGLPAAGGAPFVLQIQFAPLPIQIDGATIATATWPALEQIVDANLAEELATIGIVLPPGGTQTAVAGSRP